MANGTASGRGTTEERFSFAALVAVLVFTDVMVVVLLSGYGII
jgi:hypothetical protein